MGLEELAERSRFYGGNSEYVIAGGGNTSYKDNDFLFVKASGTSLGQVRAADFVKMNRASLAAIWDKKYPRDTDARESAVLADMMASRCPGEEAKRPSVETLLHDILPYTYVVHTHPALVNGLTCSREGKNAAAELFPQAIWIPLINPGYILSKAVKDAFEVLNQAKNAPPQSLVILLQNHGIFVAANTTEEIDEIYQAVMERLGKTIQQKPDFGGAQTSFDNSEAVGKKLLGEVKKTNPGPWYIRFERNNQIAAFVADEAAFKPVSSAYTPDHMVYSGSDPLFVKDISNLEPVFKAHIEKIGRTPKIIAVQSLGVFGLANSEKAVENALELFKDTQKVALYSDAFGGPLFMNDEMIRFINNWEAERYRSQAAVK